jgi:hypothetical protein
VRVIARAIAVAPDVGDVTVMKETVNECPGHDFVAETFAAPGRSA